MKKSTWVLVGLTLLVMTLGTTAMADTYTFIYQNGNVIPGAASYGTVTLSDSTCTGFTNCLKFDVKMDSPYLVHTSNTAFAFDTDLSVTTANFVAGTAGAELQFNQHMDGYGDFRYGVGLSALHEDFPNGIDHLVFYLGGFTLSATDFNLIRQGANKTYFAAFVTPGTSCTGYVATGGPNGDNSLTRGTNNAGSNSACGGTSTPEPASMTLLLAGLVSFAGLATRKLFR